MTNYAGGVINVLNFMPYFLLDTCTHNAEINLLYMFYAYIADAIMRSTRWVIASVFLHNILHQLLYSLMVNFAVLQITLLQSQPFALCTIQQKNVQAPSIKLLRKQ